MLRKEASKLAKSLMQEHGLFDWQLQGDRSKRRFGQCRYSTKTISLSIPLILLNSEDEVRDVILHEIAHALVGPGHGHGEVWKRKAVEIGAKPARCYGDEVATPKHTWTGTCPTCGLEVQRHVLRARSKTLACGDCCKGQYDPKHKFVWVKN